MALMGNDIDYSVKRADLTQDIATSMQCQLQCLMLLSESSTMLMQSSRGSWLTREQPASAGKPICSTFLTAVCPNAYMKS